MTKFFLKILLLFTLLLPGFSFASSSTWWERVLGFFGFSNTQSAQETTTSNQNVINASDLLESKKASQASSGGSLKSIKKISMTNLALSPSQLRVKEPYLVLYKCPESQVLKEASFSFSGNEGIALLHASKSKEEFIICKNQSTGEESKFTAKLTVSDPKINEFRLNPSNPKEGELVTVTWSTSDFKECILKSAKGAFPSQKALSSSYSFQAKKGDILNLQCLDKTGLLSIKTIKI